MPFPINIPQRVQLARIAACTATDVYVGDMHKPVRNKQKEKNRNTSARLSMISLLMSELGFMGFDWCCRQAGYTNGGPAYEGVYYGTTIDARPHYEELVKRLRGD